MGRRCATSVDTSSHLTKKLPSNYQDILHAADLGSLALNRRHDVRSEASKSGKAGIGRQIERNIRCRLFGEVIYLERLASVKMIHRGL
ncbi:hypothetical protein T4B_12645 [Trichinella pseudospiralis]|uniref:Uncharacterized protein n=1 Tax=Trichinella pseudospiralis TaxID=6337 RepID=A0A0V1JCK6_TRIPS|nr:hypothetical protein T4B_12645 [Trichinella pseudospiralis]